MDKINTNENPLQSIEGAEKISSVEHVVEKLPTSWLEYFDEPYPKIVQEFLQKKDRQQLDVILKDVIDNLNNFGVNNNIKALYESYLEIVNFDKTNTDDFKIFNDLGLEMTSKYIRSLCCCYLPEYRSHFNKDDLSGLEVSQKSFVAKYIESLLESAKSVSEKMRPAIFQYPNDWVIFRSSEDVFEILSEIEKNNPDIFYIAPRSALFSAGMIKDATHIVAENNKEITEPYFAYPKSKGFRITSTGDMQSSLSEQTQKEVREINDLFVAYLMNPSTENKNNILKNLIEYNKDNIKDHEAYSPQLLLSIDAVISDVDDLVKIIEGKLKEGKKTINIATYDETIDKGDTIRALRAIINIAKKFIDTKYKSDLVKIIEASPIDSTGNYESWPKYLKGERYGSGKLKRYSFINEAKSHHFSKIVLETSHAVGCHFGYLYEEIKKLTNVN